MKKIIYAFLVVSAILLGGCVVGTQTTTSNINDTHPDPTFSVLDSYGQWVNVPGLGTVWRPYDENNWQPYYNGQWIWTDQGWLWQSDEPYGWVVYHYGNWDYSDAYGWVWLPNYVWQPARVRWYQSNGYIGWAPMPPPGSSTASIIYNNGYVNKAWVFVPEQQFDNNKVGQYRTRDVSPDVRILRSSNGERAPEVRNIESITHHSIVPVKPEREEMKAGNRQLVRYRIPNNGSNQGNNVRNNTGREEPIQTKPPADINRRPEPANPSGNENHNVIPPKKPVEPQKPNTKERENNNNNLRNNNGRNVNDTRNNQDNSNNSRNQNIQPPAKPVEPQKPAPVPREPQKPAPVPRVPQKPAPPPKERAKNSINSGNTNGRNVNNPRPEPKKNETKTVEKKRPEPKKTETKAAEKKRPEPKQTNKEVKKKETKTVKKQKTVKDKTKKEVTKEEKVIK